MGQVEPLADDELLFDVQATVVLSPLEERIIQSVSRAMFGALLCWVSLQRLVDEVGEYKTHRRRRH